MLANSYIEFLKANKGSDLTRDQLLSKYYSMKQKGGNNDQLEQLREWWYYVNNRIGMTDEGDDIRDQFINDLLRVANGRPITQTIFTIAHAMWHGDGVIHSGIFGTKRDQLNAINESFESNEPSLMAFLTSYLDQMKYVAIVNFR